MRYTNRHFTYLLTYFTIIYSVDVNDHLLQISLKSVQYFCKAKEMERD